MGSLRGNGYDTASILVLQAVCWSRLSDTSYGVMGMDTFSRFVSGIYDALRGQVSSSDINDSINTLFNERIIVCKDDRIVLTDEGRLYCDHLFRGRVRNNKRGL